MIKSSPDNFSIRMVLIQLYWIPFIYFLISTQMYFEWPDWTTVTGFIIGFLLWIILFLKFVLSAKSKLKKQMELGNAIFTFAEILKIHETNTRINKQPLFKIEFLIENSDQTPYKALHSQTAPLIKVGELKKGKKLPVVIDKKNPKLMEIVWDKVGEEANIEEQINETAKSIAPEIFAVMTEVASRKPESVNSEIFEPGKLDINSIKNAKSKDEIIEMILIFEKTLLKKDIDFEQNFMMKLNPDIKNEDVYLFLEKYTGYLKDEVSKI